LGRRKRIRPKKKENEMIIKSLSLKKLAITLTLGVLMSVAAFGQNVNRTLVVSRDAKLGSATLAQGKYSIEFDDKKEGEAVITKNGREVAKAAYKLVDLTKDASDNAVVFSLNSDGSFQIRRFEMKGSKIALQFE
jgi:hypothetical protein